MSETYLAADRESAAAYDKKEFTMMLTPWTVQNIALELVANHFINNDPEKLGYKFKQKYSPDKLQSGIFLDIAYHWDSKVVGQRPAVFVARGSSKVASQVMNQTVGSSVRESEKTKMTLNYMNLGISCIATNIGFTEDLADYVKHPFLYFSEQIREDYRMRRFRLEDVSAPQMYAEAKDHFVVMLSVSTVFDERWVVKGDDLKLKTISRSVFEGVTKNLMVNQ